MSRFIDTPWTFDPAEAVLASAIASEQADVVRRTPSHTPMHARRWPGDPRPAGGRVAIETDFAGNRTGHVMDLAGSSSSADTPPGYMGGPVAAGPDVGSRGPTRGTPYGSTVDQPRHPTSGQFVGRGVDPWNAASPQHDDRAPRRFVMVDAGGRRIDPAQADAEPEIGTAEEDDVLDRMPQPSPSNHPWPGGPGVETIAEARARRRGY